MNESPIDHMRTWLFWTVKNPNFADPKKIHGKFCARGEIVIRKTPVERSSWYNLKSGAYIYLATQNMYQHNNIRSERAQIMSCGTGCYVYLLCQASDMVIAIPAIKVISTLVKRRRKTKDSLMIAVI